MLVGYGFQHTQLYGLGSVQMISARASRAVACLRHGGSVETTDEHSVIFCLSSGRLSPLYSWLNVPGQVQYFHSR